MCAVVGAQRLKGQQTLGGLGETASAHWIIIYNVQQFREEAREPAAAPDCSRVWPNSRGLVFDYAGINRGARREKKTIKTDYTWLAGFPGPQPLVCGRGLRISRSRSVLCPLPRSCPVSPQGPRWAAVGLWWFWAPWLFVPWRALGTLQPRNKFWVPATRVQPVFQSVKEKNNARDHPGVPRQCEFQCWQSSESGLWGFVQRRSGAHDRCSAARHVVLHRVQGKPWGVWARRSQEGQIPHPLCPSASLLLLRIRGWVDTPRGTKKQSYPGCQAGLL